MEEMGRTVLRGTVAHNRAVAYSFPFETCLSGLQQDGDPPTRHPLPDYASADALRRGCCIAPYTGGSFYFLPVDLFCVR